MEWTFRNLFVAAALVVLARGLVTLGFLLQSFRFLSRSDGARALERFDVRLVGGPTRQNALKRGLPLIHILIPALREQNRILPTLEFFVENFLADSVRIAVITTEREFEKELNQPATRELVERFIDERGLRGEVECLHYPNPSGQMADQLNFALQEIDDRAFVAVYNADSRPHPKTIEHFRALLASRPESEVFQQSAVFLRNFDQLGGELGGRFLQASAILQTRWTLAHEIPRLLRQNRNRPEWVRTYANCHLVGHGLFVRAATLRSAGGFPTTTLNEDLFLGYLLKSKGIRPEFLPVLELADSPATLRGLWDQKFVWFFGEMNQLSYFRYAWKRRRELAIRNLKIPAALSLQGLVTSLAWLISGPLTALSIAGAALLGSREGWLAAAAVAVYGPLQWWIVAYRLPDLFRFAGARHGPLSRASLAAMALMSVPAIVFNSLPPWFSLLAEVRRRFFGTAIYKPKTDD